MERLRRIAAPEVMGNKMPAPSSSTGRCRFAVAGHALHASAPWPLATVSNLCKKAERAVIRLQQRRGDRHMSRCSCKDDGGVAKQCPCVVGCLCAPAAVPAYY
jgi:hypothetical protein